MNSKDSQPAHATTAETAEQLRADIDRTRDQLGDTVAALAAKADVKGRAQQKVSDVSGKLASSLATGRDRAAGAGKDIGEAVADKKAEAGESAGQLAGTVQQQAAVLASNAAAVIGKGRDNLPEPARKAVGQASSFVSKYRAQVAAALAVLAGLLVIRRRRSR